MDGKNSVGRFWPFSRRHDAHRPEPKAAERLTTQELTHLAYVMEQWCAGSAEKQALAAVIIARAEGGFLRAHITWDGDMPDALGCRFVIERDNRVDDPTQPTAAIEELYSQWERTGKKLAPSEELQLIDRCLDLHDAAFAAASPLAMNMIRLGARACELIVTVHGMGYGDELKANLSEKQRTCVLSVSSKSFGKTAVLTDAGYVKLQTACSRLDRLARSQGFEEVRIDAFIEPPRQGKLDVRALSDFDVRALFALKTVQLFGGAGFDRPARVQRYLADARAICQPRMDALVNQEADSMKAAVGAAPLSLKGYAISPEVLEVMAKTLGGAPAKPSAADLRRYAVDMAGLLKPENTKGLKDHVIVQRAETTIKAWLDYFRACEDGIPLAFKWEDFTQCLALVGHARDKLGKDTPFIDKDAEAALQQLLKVERPPTAQPEAGSKAS